MNLFYFFALFLAVTLIAWRHATWRRKKPFANREEFSWEQIYELLSREYDVNEELAKIYWDKIADLFGLKSGVLRPGDRFSVELGTCDFNGLTDELDEICEFFQGLAQTQWIGFNTFDFDTIGDIIGHLTFRRTIMDFEAIAYTPHRLDNQAILRGILSKTEELFSKYTHFIYRKDGKLVTQSAKNTDDELFNAYANGQLIILGHGFELHVNWRRLNKTQSNEYRSVFGTRQNEIALLVGSEYVHRNDFSMKIISFCDFLSQLISVSYVYASRIGVSHGDYDRQMRLENGLLDVYWLNIFGQPYTKFLENSRVENVTRVADIQISDGRTMIILNYDPIQEEGVRHHFRDIVRGLIGRSYFKTGFTTSLFPKKRVYYFIRMLCDWVCFFRYGGKARHVPFFDCSEIYDIDEECIKQ